MSPAAVIFDVDDTLYPERTFVEGAMLRVATWLAERAGRSTAAWHSDLLQILETHGRGEVFNRVLAAHELPGSWVPLLLHHYRCATPRLALYPDAAPLLNALTNDGMRLGAVTDGLALVQNTKVQALGLNTWMDAVVLTGALPAGCAKPSPVPFGVALDMLEVPPERAVYVANDASKDFAGPTAIGMSTIFVTRAAWEWREDSSLAVADVTVHDLAGALQPIKSLLETKGV